VILTQIVIKMATKTYYITQRNDTTRVLTDSTPPWANIDSAVSQQFRDIMTAPSQPLYVTKVGDEGSILVSPDGGATWVVPAGSATGMPETWREVWIVDGNFGYTCGRRGSCAKTVDGGVTWDFTAQMPTPGGGFDLDLTSTALHFISPLVGIVATNKWVFKTTDGGASWTMLTGAEIVGLSSEWNAVHMSADEQTIIVHGTTEIMRSTDGGATFVNVQNYPDDQGRHMTWINDTELWSVGATNMINKSNDAGATWIIVQPWTGIPTDPDIWAAHFTDSNNGYISYDNLVHVTTDGGVSSVLSDTGDAIINSIWTSSDSPEPCYRLLSCDTNVYPNIDNVQGDIGIDLMAVTGQVISTLDLFGTERCYTVEQQVDIPCQDVPNLIVLAFTLIGSDCASFSLETCPTEIPLTLVGDTVIVDVQINNLSANDHTFVGSFGSCTSSGITILNPGIPIAAGSSGIMNIEYSPTMIESGQCELIVTGPCGPISCQLCFQSVQVPDCSHFNICITGATCAPDCIKPGEIISFDLGGNISPVAYPTVVTFQVVNQVTQEIVFTQNFPVANDMELDAIVINVIAPGPGKYCAEVCLPGCNTKRVLCFDVCEPFDIYKDSCNHWHVHRPTTCHVEEYLVCVRQFNCKDPIIEDVLWDVSQDNTFEFEVPNDGIFIFEMKDTETGEVIYSFSAFETCALQKCFQLMMDKIMCSCADPCCKKCDGSPEEEREFSRMSLNKLVPLYLTYLGMARRSQLYTVGMKFIDDDHNCFLHDANQILGKINDIIMDCGCLCPGQENTASNRGDCKTC